MDFDKAVPGTTTRHLKGFLCTEAVSGYLGEKGRQAMAVTGSKEPLFQQVNTPKTFHCFWWESHGKQTSPEKRNLRRQSHTVTFWNHHYVNKTKCLGNLFVLGRRVYLLFRKAWVLYQLPQSPCLYTCFDSHNLTFISRSLICTCQGKRELPEDIPAPRNENTCPHFVQPWHNRYSLGSFTIP